MSTGDLLSSSSVCERANALLAPGTALASPLEALTLVTHAIHLLAGFRPSSMSPTSSGSAGLVPDGVLSQAFWDDARGSPAFTYRHEQSALKFETRVVRAGDARAVIVATAVEDNKSRTMEVTLSDYFSPSSFPARTPSSPSSDGGDSSSSSSSTPSFDLLKLFNSPARATDLTKLYRINILQPLIPGLQKEGYQELDPASVSGSSNAGGGGPGPSSSSGTAGSGAGRVPPGFYPDSGGPMGMYPPPRHGGGIGSPLNAGPSLGANDLLPLGGMGGTTGGGLRAPGFGGGGFGAGGFGGGGGGDMFMGTDHPFFRERFGPSGSLHQPGGGIGAPPPRWGGDGFLPPGGAPPGARFDPVGPGNGPPTSTGIGLGGPQGRVTEEQRRQMGIPDWDGEPRPNERNADYDSMFG